MKAVIHEEYGSPDVLRHAEVPTPTPAENEVLIRIHAVSINGSDCEGLIGEPMYARMGGLRKPRHPILGSDIAGVVVGVGTRHTEFRIGDEVFGEIPGYRNGFAEYVCTHGRTMLRKPAAMTFEQAAAIPQAGVIAYNGIIKKGAVRGGQKVLINGAGGSAGSFAVQLAKLQGAEVTGVDNATKLDFIRSLGADHVIDYQATDFTQTGEEYDLILDVIAHRSPFAYARALRKGGTYYCVGGYLRVVLQIVLADPLIRSSRRKHVRMLVVPQNRADLVSITALCEAGTIVPPIDRVFPFSEVPAAMRYVADGFAKGKVVVTVP